jgi:hypothetical protein
MEVGDDLCECKAEDLCEVWSGERGSQASVNRIQWYAYNQYCVVLSNNVRE